MPYKDHPSSDCYLLTVSKSLSPGYTGWNCSTIRFMCIYVDTFNNVSDVIGHHYYPTKFYKMGD